SSSRHGSSHDNCSTIPASDYAPQILPAARDKLANAMPGTKRKASTTAEQHRELSYSGEENLGSESGQQNLGETGSHSPASTAPPGPVLLLLSTNNISATGRSGLGSEPQGFSPKDLTDFSFADAVSPSTL